MIQNTEAALQRIVDKVQQLETMPLADSPVDALCALKEVDQLLVKLSRSLSYQAASFQINSNGTESGGDDLFYIQARKAGHRKVICQREQMGQLFEKVQAITLQWLCGVFGLLQPKRALQQGEALFETGFIAFRPGELADFIEEYALDPASIAHAFARYSFSLDTELSIASALQLVWLKGGAALVVLSSEADAFLVFSAEGKELGRISYEFQGVVQIFPSANEASFWCCDMNMNRLSRFCVQGQSLRLEEELILDTSVFSSLRLLGVCEVEDQLLVTFLKARSKERRLFLIDRGMEKVREIAAPASLMVSPPMYSDGYLHCVDIPTGQCFSCELETAQWAEFVSPALAGKATLLSVDQDVVVLSASPCLYWLSSAGKLKFSLHVGESNAQSGIVACSKADRVRIALYCQKSQMVQIYSSGPMSL